MSPERDERAEEHEQDLYEDVPPRSIFAATWFRVVLVVIVLGVIGAVAVPYVLDWMNPPPSSRSASASKSPLLAVPTPAPPASDDKTTEKSPSKSDKKDSLLVPAPAPVTPPLAAAPVRPEGTSEPKSGVKPTSEPKSSAKAAPDAKGTAPDAKAGAADAKPATPSAETKTAMAVTDSSAKSGTAKAPAKPDATAKSETTPATATKPTATRPAAAKATPSSPAAVGGAPYWVQVGAFKDPETAKRVASKLRDENFKVEESVKQLGGTAPAAAAPAVKPSPAPTGTDQYDVFVTGMSVDELNRRLAGKGLAGEATTGGVVVKPSLPLRDAVALSKDLAVDGFKVQVRRAGGTAAAPPAPVTAAAPAEGGQALHRVRVGSFADRTAAQAAARELEAKGYKPYIARGDQ
jgi:sporulation related protein